jgi:hypothetical protein
MSEMATLQRTVASFVEEALDRALGKYRERLALGDDVGSGR